MTNSDFTHLEEWRCRLRKVAEEAAKGKDGAAVVRAMNRAVQRANCVWLDELYDDISKAKSSQGLWLAFDITWLTALALELRKVPKSRAKAMKVRTKG